jgi:hypothetical protein
LAPVRLIEAVLVPLLMVIGAEGLPTVGASPNVALTEPPPSTSPLTAPMVRLLPGPSVDAMLILVPSFVTDAANP